MKHTKVIAVKAGEGERVVDVLGAPFGSPTDKDADGEYFTPSTDFWLEEIPTRPIIYGHGFKALRPEVIGVEHSAEIRDEGLWFRVHLLETPEALKVWKAAEEGHAFASTGAISHLVRMMPDGKILSWPTAELSLVDDREFPPANAKARVEIAARKAVYPGETYDALEAGERAVKAMLAARDQEIRDRAYWIFNS